MNENCKEPCDEVHEWADVEVAKMLARVRRVCIMEYGWMIDALK